MGVTAGPHSRSMTMQDEPWLLCAMEIGGLVGFVSFALAASAAIWLRRRRRAQEKERPPQTTNLLRPPGYSLQQRLETLNDNWYDSALQLMLFGGLSGACVARSEEHTSELQSR